MKTADRIEKLIFAIGLTNGHLKRDHTVKESPLTCIGTAFRVSVRIHKHTHLIGLLSADILIVLLLPSPFLQTFQKLAHYENSIKFFFCLCRFLRYVQ